MEPGAALAVAGPLLMGLAAVGAVIYIKTARRRQAPTHGAVGDAVPVRAMSAEHARRLRLRYWWSAAAVLLGVAIAAVLLAA